MREKHCQLEEFINLIVYDGFGDQFWIFLALPSCLVRTRLRDQVPSSKWKGNTGGKLKGAVGGD